MSQPHRWVFFAKLLVLFGSSVFTVCAMANSDAANDETATQDLTAGQPATCATSLSGVVSDSRGNGVVGVSVELLAPAETATHLATTDKEGKFALSGLTAGSYSVRVKAHSLEPLTPFVVTVAACEDKQLAITVSRMLRTRTTVEVNASLDEIAEAQVHEAEAQRVLGILPNYYTSYIWDAAAMTPKLKFQMALKSNTDPLVFIVAGAVAGVEQAHKTFPGYGQEAEGYGMRYGATYADSFLGKFLGAAVFPTLFHQDPRYFYMGTGSARTRLWYALVSTFVCRSDGGQLEPNYSRVFGAFAASGLSNVYRSPADRGLSLTLRNGAVIIAGGTVINVFREFVSKKLTTNVPDFAKGKPDH